jgi:hypothetical protein
LQDRRHVGGLARVGNGLPGRTGLWQPVSMPYRPIRPGFGATLREAWRFATRPAPSLPAVIEPRAPVAGTPVLVIPALLRGDGHAATLRAALDRAGYRAFGWGLGVD